MYFISLNDKPQIFEKIKMTRTTYTICSNIKFVKSMVIIQFVYSKSLSFIVGVFHSFLHNSVSPFPKASLMAQMVNGLPAVQETQVPFLSQNNPLEKETASHFSIPAWRIPWTEEPGRLQSMRSLRARYY